ncbi:MAG: ATP-binding protein [Candidatus Zixiibacteriota bacterium]
MTVRAKLILSYSVMAATVVAAAVATTLAMINWQDAAGKLAHSRQQSMQAEALRVMMFRQVTKGLDYLSNAGGTVEDFQQLQVQIKAALDKLLAGVTSDIEADHVESLDETQTELRWVLAQILTASTGPGSRFDPVGARTRLREIADEVTDDVAILNQYYHHVMDDRLADASRAGQSAVLTAGIAVVIALSQLLVLVILSNRWLVRPMSRITQVTERISQGDFDDRVGIEAADEWGTLATAIDKMASSLKALERQLLAKERFAAHGEIIAYTAHNIKNPLAAIRAAAQVTLRAVEDRDHETAESLKDIVATVDRMDAWVKGLMNLAAPTQLRQDDVDINQLVDEVLHIAETRAAGDGVGLVREFGNDLPRIRVDSALIQQALSVVISNAIEAESRTIRVITGVKRGAVNDRMLTVTIADDGRGVSPEVMPKLFRAFVTDKKGGTGLGLAQAKKFVELHRGLLTIQSEPEKGTTVLIELPESQKPTPPVS